MNSEIALTLLWVIFIIVVIATMATLHFYGDTLLPVISIVAIFVLFAMVLYYWGATDESKQFAYMTLNDKEGITKDCNRDKMTCKIDGAKTKVKSLKKIKDTSNMNSDDNSGNIYQYTTTKGKEGLSTKCKLEHMTCTVKNKTIKVKTISLIE